MKNLIRKNLGPNHHGDITQMVNSRYCVLVLLVLAVCHVIILSVFFQRPIQCFCPPHFTSEQCDLVKVSCLSKKTYTLATTSEIPQMKNEETLPLTIPQYYNTVSLILLLQALLFFIPSVIWRELARNVGMIPDEVSLLALQANHIENPSFKESAISNIAESLKVFCMRQMRRRQISYAFRWFHGNQLVALRLLALLLYVANAVGQFFMLDGFLGMPFHTLGWEVMGRPPVSFTVLDYLKAVLSSLGLTDAVETLNREGVISSDIEDLVQNYSIPYFDENKLSMNTIEFYLDVLCDMTTRNLGNVHHHTIQCHLPANSVNKVIFTFVWFLLCTTAVLTITSLSVSAFQFFIFPCRRMGIRERLQDAGVIQRHDPSDRDTIAKIELFEREFLQRDGLFLLSYIEAGGGDLLKDKVLQLLWNSYVEALSDIEQIAPAAKWSEQFVEDITEIPAYRDVPTDRQSTTIMLPLVNQQISQEDRPPAYNDLAAEGSTPSMSESECKQSALGQQEVTASNV